MVRKSPSKKSAKSASSVAVVSKEASASASKDSPAKSTPKKKPTTPAREVLYPEVEVKLFAGSNPFTVAHAKQVLGWQTESENIKFGNNYLLTDVNGEKVRCYHNVTNRPLYRGVVETLKQEHLCKKWKLNGEPLIIGRTGLVLNGQHQMIALILAAQEWEKHRGKWHDYWETEPTMEKVVITGISEEDTTVNTMDTCKPRSLSDVIYRSAYFADSSPKERKVVSRDASYAVKLLWERTGASLDAYRPMRTHSESLDFIGRHPRLLLAVKHIYEENGAEQNIGRLISCGAAAGLLYLMAASKTDRETEDNTGYAQVNDPSEAQLDLSRWEKACEFWVLVAAGSKTMNAIRLTLAALAENGHTTLEDRAAVFIKAWNLYSSGKPVTAEGLALSYAKTSEGGERLAEVPVTGGIDVGKAEK